MSPNKALFIIITTLLFGLDLNGQPQFELSQNIYRAPYGNGIVFDVSRDHFDHTPVGRYDLIAQGTNGCNSHSIVAAADGVVRYIQDSNFQSCPDTCQPFNNYVWLAHANGEWTKYTHIAQNSVPNNISIGDTISAGTHIGFECWVGATTPAFGRHLHFEVRKPNDPINPPIAVAGGFLNSSDGVHIIPVLCGVTNNFIMNTNDQITAGNCGICRSTIDVSFQNESYGFNQAKVEMTEGIITASSVLFNNGANGLYQSVFNVTLKQGFQAKPGSFLQVRTGPCDATIFN